MISSVSEMYPTAVIRVFWMRDSFCVAHTFRLPCHISIQLRNLDILCNVLSFTSFFISELFSVFLVCKAGSVPAKIALLAPANCHITSFSQRVSPVVFDCLQLIACRQWEKLTTTPITCGILENMSRATLDRSVYFECVSSCWHHQLVMSGIQNVLLISIGSQW